MSSRVSHVPYQPKVVYYWDYYILCRLNVAAALALQRLEYWDGTKEAASRQTEAGSEHVATTTQQAPRWIYKTQEELHWELMGVTGEKGVAVLTKVLEEDLGYLVSRRNPQQAFDRRKHYAFQAGVIQHHLNYLAALLTYFQQQRVCLTPVYYAIEQLTREGGVLEALSIERILGKLMDLRQDQRLPTFVKQGLAKAIVLPERPATEALPFRSFAEWKATGSGESIPQDEAMETIPPRIGTRNHAGSTTRGCGNNSSNYQHSLPSLITENKTAVGASTSLVPLPDATTTAELSGRKKGEDHAVEPAQEVSVPGVLSQMSPAVPTGKPMPSPLNGEAIVSCWEDLLGQRYAPQMRMAQWRAASALLQMSLPVPLSLALLQQVYETYCDDFWKQRYGTLHLSHLVQTEKRSGQVRIVRWIARLLLQERGYGVQKGSEGDRVATPGTTFSVLEMAEPSLSEPAMSAQDKGGFERFRDGDDPDDDLDAVVKRLQAAGRLPVLAAR
jgi:hypothetical protein